MSHRRTIMLLTSIMVFLGYRVTPAMAQCQVDELVGLFASDNTAGDNFGIAVAIEGNMAIVGAYNDDDNGTASGAAYVFHYDGASWIQQAKLLPSDGAAEGYFGASVAIEADTIVVGSYGAVQGAYIFEKPGDGWTDMTETAKLVGSDVVAGARFGLTVTLSNDTIAVGATGDDTNGVFAGAAYIFVKPVGGWVNMTQTAKLLPSDGAAQDQFGSAVAISGDAVLIGALFDQDNGYHSGSVYVFDRPSGGWVDMTHSSKLVPADGAGTGQAFGVSIAADGDVAVIGALYDDDNGLLSGSVYVVRLSESGWVWDAKLLASNGHAGDAFGEGVAIWDDTIVVGTPRHQGSGQGSAYVFHKPPTGWVNATEDVELVPSDSALGDRFGGERFGVSVSDGIAVVGAFSSDVNGEDAGAAYSFQGLTDCNGNGVLDTCDIDDGTSPDVNGNGIPDECDPGACCLADLTCVTHLSQEDCESQGGAYAGGATTCDCPAVDPVPTLNEWGMIALTVVLLVAGGAVIARRQNAAAA